MLFGIRIADLSEAKRALPQYFEILAGRRTASYLRCKTVPVEVDFGIEEDMLWKWHDRGVEALRAEENLGETGKSLLDIKLKLARHMMTNCHLCERRCAANRVRREEGHCRVLEPKISSEFLHWGEEPELVPSHTIFFSGCTFNCVFCQNCDISQNPGSGSVMSPATVADIIARRSGNSRNVNWVGGDPTSNLPFIIETLTHSHINLPQVWNSNLYLTERSMCLLDGLVDLYLTDFKYGNDACAERLSNVPNYWDVITRNHSIARSQCEMIVRHLVLPNHFDCCTKPVLEWIAGDLENVRVNVMDQYRPEYRAGNFEELTEPLGREEFRRAHRLAKDLGLNITD